MTRDEELADRLVQLTVVVLAIKAVGLLLLAGSAVFRPVPGRALTVSLVLGVAMGPPWPPAAALDAQRRLAALAMDDVTAWAFALPWLLDTAGRFPARLAPLRPA